MGIKLLILLGLLIGVLYCIHILAQDYQAISAAPKLLRFLFKRDLNSTILNEKLSVRWKMILQHDPIQCARYLYCDLGARLPDNELRRGLISMLQLSVTQEELSAFEVFQDAYLEGRLYKNEHCNKKYYTCPFKANLLLDLINYMIKTRFKVEHSNSLHIER